MYCNCSFKNDFRYAEPCIPRLTKQYQFWLGDNHYFNKYSKMVLWVGLAQDLIKHDDLIFNPHPPGAPPPFALITHLLPHLVFISVNDLQIICSTSSCCDDVTARAKPTYIQKLSMFIMRKWNDVYQVPTSKIPYLQIERTHC